ncbi:excalibur calcium-binding domain-containing protein [Bacillus sp. USDA818B3_A]|uniref:excalibur calcium-binding domain-containing protein n=1 Tax=Bacillus sp. USDA818B3_A TaxID=2698834 RepID=UPI00136D41F2|nr:excalibur calcium-binding domain-containing protein [Bacillus sp. USDA818B3_A]
MKKLMAVLLTLSFAFMFGLHNASAADKDCGDFTSQAAAQQYFISGGGSTSYNFNALDHDHDGQACEDYSYASSGGTLPDTATPYATEIIIGLSLVALGFVLVLRKRAVR